MNEIITLGRTLIETILPY